MPQSSRRKVHNAETFAEFESDHPKRLTKLPEWNRGAACSLTLRVEKGSTDITKARGSLPKGC